MRRQENIFELIYTEKDFVDDLIYVEQVRKRIPLFFHFTYIYTHCFKN